MQELYLKYINEYVSLINGLYSDFDGRFIYSTVREHKPLKILDFAPREGKTTNCIVHALLNNIFTDKQKIEYYIFEKDEFYLNAIQQYLEAVIDKFNVREYITFHYSNNIIDNPVLDSITDLDLLFIDANHDYILAKWYVDNLFKKVKVGGIIHVHDIHYNRN